MRAQFRAETNAMDLSVVQRSCRRRYVGLRDNKHRAGQVCSEAGHHVKFVAIARTHFRHHQVAKDSFGRKRLIPPRKSFPAPPGRYGSWAGYSARGGRSASDSHDDQSARSELRTGNASCVLTQFCAETNSQAQNLRFPFYPVFINFRYGRYYIIIFR